MTELIDPRKPGNENNPEALLWYAQEMLSAIDKANYKDYFSAIPILVNILYRRIDNPIPIEEVAQQLYDKTLNWYGWYNEPPSTIN